jgi:hypothetical protein
MRPTFILYIAILFLAGCATEELTPAKEQNKAAATTPLPPTLPVSTPKFGAITIEEALEDARLLILADESTFHDYSREVIERRYKHRPFWDELNVVVSIMNFRQVSGSYGVAIKKDDGWHVIIQTDTPPGKMPKPDKLYFYKDRLGLREIWYPADNDGRPIR